MENRKTLDYIILATLVKLFMPYMSECEIIFSEVLYMPEHKAMFGPKCLYSIKHQSLNM